MIIVIMAVLVGCGSSSSSDTYNPVIDPASFVNAIDNSRLPMTPGTTYTYEGETADGSETNIVEVTFDTKEILSVTCVVVHDTVFIDGELAEETFDWYAQDIDGNVWYFGEDSKEYDAGVVVSTTGSWEAGVDGAKPGIVMKSNPQVGDTYRQEYYAGEAEDWAEVVSLSESVDVPYGSFDNCLKTKDWSALEPAVIEYKYYCDGIGTVLETLEDGSEPIELVSIAN